MFSGLGKESGGCKGVIQVWINNQLIYNPTNISLPINLQTPLTYTYQLSNLYPKPHKLMLNPNNVMSVINKKFNT
jgi:hypothetical protein